jgi:hypothetical protein
LDERTSVVSTLRKHGDGRLPPRPHPLHLVESADERAQRLPGAVLLPEPTRPPKWVHELLEVVAAARPLIDSATVDELTSDKVLTHLRPGLLELGYEIGRQASRSEDLPAVPFGDQGRERVAYEVDAVHVGRRQRRVEKDRFGSSR